MDERARPVRDSHPQGPESCRHAREGVPEALTGVRAGRGIEPRKEAKVPGAHAVERAEGNTDHPANGEGWNDPAWSEDPEHVRKHLAREPGDPVTAPGRMEHRGRGGKSKDVIRR